MIETYFKIKILLDYIIPLGILGIIIIGIIVLAIGSKFIEKMDERRRGKE